MWTVGPFLRVLIWKFVQIRKICKKSIIWGVKYNEYNEPHESLTNKNIIDVSIYSLTTSHSAYDATSIESNGVKIDGFLYPNFM